MAEGITFESVKLLKPEPGEVVIVTLNESTGSGGALLAATEQLAAFFPDNRLVILEHGDAVETVPDVDAAIEFLEGLRG